MIPTFTVHDIFVMMQTLNTKTLIGFSNPFEHLTKYEIEREWEKTYKKLHKLNLIDLIDKEIKLEENFGNALWIMSRTNMVVEIIKDGNQKSYFYFSKDHVVECKENEESEYTLYVHGTPDHVWNNVIYPRMLVGVESHTVEVDESIFVPTAAYNAWVKAGAVTDVQSLEAINSKENWNRISSQLDAALKSMIHNNRLMVFFKEDAHWVIEGMHVLTSPNNNWTFKMIQKDNKELLEGKQSSNLDIVSEILEVLVRMQKQKATIK
ncbi:hypothetical protein MHB48_08995 [Psychrobacillus sp. FSL H8-0483]|uniref:hypothetical protein n=1 Tax=Psychrobacillus sp. FSL H8-0483 TaxID=2921389 RepID=UPI00315A267F